MRYTAKYHTIKRLWYTFDLNTQTWGTYGYQTRHAANKRADKLNGEILAAKARMKAQYGCMHPIQTSHVNEETLMKNCPDFAKSLWRYQYTTSEWIPIFHFVGTQQELFRLVDHEPLVDPYSDDKDALWVTPKGSPRPQHY